MFKTIAEVKKANKELNHFFFDRGTMRFFNSRIESGLYKNQCFVTSEINPNNTIRKYTIRIVNKNGSINTVGDYMQYSTLECARDNAKEFKNVNL